MTGITILGMMGEANKLSSEESEIFMHHMLKVIDSRVPVIVGISDPGLQNLDRLAQKSVDAGCCGVMVAPPTGLKTERDIINYFSKVFHALGDKVPVCYQDYPQSTGVHISVECLNRLIQSFPQLVMFKHEDCPGLAKLTRIRQASDSRDGPRRISILVGNGGLYLPEELSRGADGAMTGFAFPEMLVEVVKLFSLGREGIARDIFDAYMPLVRYEQQPGFGLAIRKEVLRRRGIIATSKTRYPGSTLDKTDLDELSILLGRLQERLDRLG